MSLASKNVILASDFVSLKARVKAEMNRRCRSGSLTSYAGTNYDYSVTPASNGKILPEHLNKLTTPVNAISDCGIAEKHSGDVIQESRENGGQQAENDVEDERTTSRDLDGLDGSPFKQTYK